MDNAVVKQFDQLVYGGSLPDTVAFLKQLPKAEVPAVRARTRQLLRELNAWNNAAVYERLFLAGLATYSQKEALSRSFELPPSFNYSNPRHQHGHQQLFLEVLRHRRPTWLLAWLQGQARQSAWQVPPYRLLCELLAAELLPHDPWLFAQGAATWLSRYNRNNNSHAREFDVHLLRQLQADTALLQRDLPLLLDFDTPADAQTVHRGKHGTDITWLTLLPPLVASHHLDRAQWLTGSLLALRRDFRRPLLLWLKNLYLSLQPTPDERLARQGELMELLSHALPLVVNFALDQLKDLWSNPGFATAPLLPYAEILLSRHDLKTGLRTLLAGLEKLLKRDPAAAAPLAAALAAALANPDAAVQERAARLLATLLGAKKPLLPTAAAVQADVAAYADLLSAAARTTLAPWLAAPPAADAPREVTNAYAPQAAFQPELSPATALVPVADYHEWLFLTNEALTQDDPTAYERWLAGLLRLRPQFPVGFARQLLPALHQALPWLSGQTEEQVWQALAGFDFGGDRNGRRFLVLALLAGQLPGSPGLRVSGVALASRRYSTPDPLLRVERQRLAWVEQQLTAGSAPLPLLSTPTHAPHWLAPTALVQRLRAHEAAGQQPDPADLALALARCAWSVPAEVEAARPQLLQLQHAGLRELLSWLLAPVSAPLPLPALVVRQSVGQVLGGLLRRVLPGGAGSAPAPLAAVLPWLWAVAARTRCPEATFAELHPLSAYPGVAAPWLPGYSFEPASHVVRQPWNKQQPEYTQSWRELRVPTEHAGQQPPSPLLLYSLHARLQQAGSFYLWPLLPDLGFLSSLLPHNPAPLHWHLLRTAFPTSQGYSEERNLLLSLLHTLLPAGPTFAEPTTLLLAIGLLHPTPEDRALALEALLAAIEHGRLLPAALGTVLGQLLAHAYAPVPRLADGLAQARALGSRPDDALRQVLEALLPALPAAPPRQTTKLLAAYADLVARTRHPVPAAVQIRLREWSTSAALKKLTAPLLA